MEDVIARMQDEKNGIPIRTVKSFLSKIPSVFSGKSQSEFHTILKFSLPYVRGCSSEKHFYISTVENSQSSGLEETFFILWTV